MTTPQAGDAAPDFSAPDQTGATRSLAGYAGEKLVLYFYPKDDTPGCTAEACSLRDNHRALQAEGYRVLGVSPDAPGRHVKFIDKYQLPFDLLADEDHAVARAYGVWGPKKFMGREYDGIHRTTFLIGADGKIEEVIAKVNTEEHAGQILGG